MGLRIAAAGRTRFDTRRETLPLIRDNRLPFIHIKSLPFEPAIDIAPVVEALTLDVVN